MRTRNMPLLRCRRRQRHFTAVAGTVAAGLTVLFYGMLLLLLMPPTEATAASSSLSSSAGGATSSSTTPSSTPNPSTTPKPISQAEIRKLLDRSADGLVTDKSVSKSEHYLAINTTHLSENPHLPLNASLKMMPHVNGLVDLPGEMLGMIQVIAQHTLEYVGWDFVILSPIRERFQVIDDGIRGNVTHNENVYYLCGYAEGVATVDQIFALFEAKLPANNRHVSPEEGRFLDEHLEFLEYNVRANAKIRDPYKQDPYWAQVGYFLAQVQGMADGATQQRLSDKQKASDEDEDIITFKDLFRLNLGVELEAFNEAATKNSSSPPPHDTADGEHFYPPPPPPRGDQLSSGFVKVTKDDLFFAHSSSGDYASMLRQYKIYTLPCGTVSFPGFPGIISSEANWYMSSHNLSVQNTPHVLYNPKLQENIHANSVPTFLRSVVSNFMATSGKQWIELFSRYNSGTADAQWIVIDYNNYTAGQTGDELNDGLLHILEQMPGKIRSEDLTRVLRTQTYWASYNIPYFKDVYEETGYKAQQETYGNISSYEFTARAELFRRNHSDIYNIASLQHLMRSNDYQHDPLSLIAPQVKGNNVDGCSPSSCSPKSSPILALAPRGDIVPRDAVLPTHNLSQYFERRPQGVIDCKVTSYTLLNDHLRSFVISGPTSSASLTSSSSAALHRQGGQAEFQPFSWGTEWSSIKPKGAPETYDFEWISFNKPFRRGKVHQTDTATSYLLLVGLSVGCGCLIISAIVVKFGFMKKKRTRVDDSALLSEEEEGRNDGGSSPAGSDGGGRPNRRRHRPQQVQGEEENYDDF